MSLKTKGFNPKIEAFCLIGGGETHSELLTGKNLKVLVQSSGVKQN